LEMDIEELTPNVKKSIKTIKEQNNEEWTEYGLSVIQWQHL
jgi:hypothetical protein